MTGHGRPSGSAGWASALTGLVAHRPDVASIGLGPVAELIVGAA